jgi:single-strand DNA-binding protein
MGTYNRLVVCGRVGADPRQSVSQNGKALAKFSVAVDQGSGDRKETVWLQCTAFGAVAETCAKYVGRGHMVLVDGQLSVQKYTDKNLVAQTIVGILVDRITLLPNQQRAEQPAHHDPYASLQHSSDDDIPF